MSICPYAACSSTSQHLRLLCYTAAPRLASYCSSSSSRGPSLFARAAANQKQFGSPAAACSRRPCSTSATSASAENGMMAGGRVHLVDAIVEDHKEIRAFYQQYSSSSASEDKEKWSNQWRWTVARHSIGEELVAYPAMESYVAGGEAMADKDRAEHQKVKENLAELESKGAHDPGFGPLMKQTQDALEKHMSDEEHHDLPKLRSALPENEGVRLGARFQRTKHFVPTHSHPSAPNKPPFETIVGLMAAPIDKLRDTFEKFPSEEEVMSAKSN